MQSVRGTGSLLMTTSRERWLTVLRIIFGLAYAVDASFKWRPEFIHGITDFLTGAQEGQPAFVTAWLDFWVNLVKVQPETFAYIVAVAETAIAIGLILGLFLNVATLGGAALSAVIWMTAEGFGGPYKGSDVTDVGTAIPYVIAFLAFFIFRTGLVFGVDRRLTPLLGKWGWLASGPIRKDAGSPPEK